MLDRESAWHAIQRAAILAQHTYRSWNELGDAYLRGMRLWAGGDDERVRDSVAAFEKLKADPEGPFRHPWDTKLEGAPAPDLPEPQKVEEIAAGASIIEAMARVGSGGRVILAPGTYAESITPPHSIEVVGRGDGEVILEAQGRPVVWAKAESGRAISVSVRGVTLRSGLAADGKTLNGMTVAGGFLHVRDCKVEASHHGASVRDGGLFFASKSRFATNQNGVWCEGGSVSVVDCDLDEIGLHGAYVGKSHHANVFEDTKIVGAQQIGILAETTLRVRRGTVDSAGVCGVSARALVTIMHTTIKGSKGWGIVVENDGKLQMVATTIEGSTSASLDVKEGAVEANGCTLSGGTTSGLVVQSKGRALLVDSSVEHHAQGNVYAITGAQLFMSRGTVRGKAAGVWLKDAQATFVESRLESEANVLDVKAGDTVVLERCQLSGGIAVAANATVRLADCETEGERALGEDAELDECTHEDVCATVEAALVSVQEDPPKPVYH